LVSLKSKDSVIDYFINAFDIDKSGKDDHKFFNKENIAPNYLFNKNFHFLSPKVN